ncbi:hypothetical protein WR25_00656 [Diploscapter pachys]|uniref:GDP/GTP exchange factor Sec2 N-terminal domain-containing protein n=1 Tax=Diploscapter pachys TaxID=2018661 RepID=A0A2A2JIP7_9BILA|nr:hypothetical protein WR25_00656 [Diploscapter pachys]
MADIIGLSPVRIIGTDKDPVTANLESGESPPSSNGDDFINMKMELEAMRKALEERDEKMSKMARIQTHVDAEVQELTEKLFQEAYKMVNTAEERRERAEKLLEEARLQVEVLTAEVIALKEIVQAPGMGLQHFRNTSPEHKSTLAKLFSPSSKQKRDSSSHPATRKSSTLPSTSQEKKDKEERDNEQKEADAVEEVDPILFAEFQSWKEAGHPSYGHPFMERVRTEEVQPCMLFGNQELATQIMDSILANRLELEPVNEPKPSVRECALTSVSRFCPYRVRTSDAEPWHYISLIARNRIAAVCDFFMFVRYISEGLIRCGLRDAYFHVVQLR